MVDFEVELTLARATDVSYKQAPEQVIADLLQAALNILRLDNHGNGRLDSVSQRVADASLILRCVMEDPKSGWANVHGVEGLNCPTGMGALLSPRPVAKKAR